MIGKKKKRYNISWPLVISPRSTHSLPHYLLGSASAPYLLFHSLSSLSLLLFSFRLLIHPSPHYANTIRLWKKSSFPTASSRFHHTQEGERICYSGPGALSPFFDARDDCIPFSDDDRGVRK